MATKTEVIEGLREAQLDPQLSDEMWDKIEARIAKLKNDD